MDFKEFTERLSKHRILYVPGKFDGSDQEMLCAAIALLDTHSNDPIEIRIDSLGGDGRCAKFLCDAIRFAASPVHGVVVGDAKSAGFIILQACDTRAAYPNAELMFHGPSPNGWRTDDPRWSEELEKMIAWHEAFLKVLADRSGQPIKNLREWSAIQRIFCAQEALKLGFIDKVLRYPKKKLGTK